MKALTKNIKPFMPYMGGKRKLSSILLANSPDNFINYHEPFLGGGAMALEVMQRMYKDMAAGLVKFQPTFYLSDYSMDIVEAWTVVKDAPEELEVELRHMFAHHSKEHFDEVRDWKKNGLLDSVGIVRRAARTIYLRKSSYGCIVTEDDDGNTEASWNRARVAIVYDYENVRAMSHLLNALDTRIFYASYEAILENVKPLDFVYLDPPYAQDADDGRDVIANYISGGIDQAEVRDVVVQATRLGAYTLMSNGYTATTRELWDGWASIRKQYIHMGTRRTTEFMVANWRLAEHLLARQELAA